MVGDPIQELVEIDSEIEGELRRNRQTLTGLLKRRTSVVRVACEPRSDGTADFILELATRRAPATFSPTEALTHVRAALGPSVTPTQVTAWCSKLAKQGKLQKIKRGVYALA